MKKTIYLEDSTLQMIREGIRRKLKDHPYGHVLGKSAIGDYEYLKEPIANELNQKLKSPLYKNLVSEFNSIGNQISHFTLWTIFYNNVKKPEKRKRMNRNTAKMLLLYAFDEIREELLVESSPEEKRKIQSEARGKATLSALDLDFEYRKEINQREILQAIGNAQSEIRILKNFLNKWNSLGPYLESAATRGCKIKILVSEPHVKPVVNRSKYILPANNNINGLPELRRRILDEIETWDGREMVEIAEHDCLPGFNLFAIDDTYFLSFYWYKKETIRGPYLVIKSDHDFKRHIDKHFDKIWKESYDLRKKLRRKPKVNLNLRLKKYIGHWYLYCNRGAKDKESYQLRFMEQGEVAENMLILQANGYQLQATFVSSDPQVEKLNGFAELHPIHDEFLEIKVRIPFEKDSIHFLMNIGQHHEDYILGVYNYIYPKHPMLGTGLAAMVRAEGNLDDIEAKIHQGIYRPLGEIEDKNTLKLLRYLTFPIGTRIEAFDGLDDKNLQDRYSKPFKFKGVYKFFAYKSGGGKTYISESLMKIDGSQQVTHQKGGNLKYRLKTSKGKAELMKDANMLVSFKNLESSKMGFMFMQCNTHDPTPGSYYTGIFSGYVLKNTQRILGNRVIIKYLGEDEGLFESTQINRYELGSPGFLKLPYEIKSLLAGRTQNSVGFYYLRGSTSKSSLERHARTELNIGQIYFESACQKALSNDVNQVEAVIEMFEQALKHGYEPKETFTKKLEEFENDGWLRPKMKKDLVSSKRFTDLLKK